MKLHAFLGLALSVLTAVAHSQPLDVVKLEQQLSSPVQGRLKSSEAAARKGDYQAMRNFAYVWASEAAREQPPAAIVGCAWYAVILKRHADKAHAGDVSNKDLYCGRLNADQARQAGALVVSIESQLPSP
ncbi:hypothetical protein [Variovorax atrisoli]|uniref:hypothetical protein n=1 Tax=Variovorax atrisoli TaxID=3394203 RepID=UPI003399878A